ncbi:HBR256Cp [Eremothecium sinecaudum]|uniref:HBR256Cp n=1 Tax=Eremothecium sinecaudum TaxID=45286 RepID=A0A120K1A1_9SACH|nr:HBR256Cp [Eremothecium sinecaudum]AMD19157.1 HBR256Cp [Eremothecium sinecaudum]
MKEKTQVSFENLNIEKIFGISSNSKSCFCNIGSKIAYVASGGVVVSDIEVSSSLENSCNSLRSFDSQSRQGEDLYDSETSPITVCSQRFFCAYSKAQLQDLTHSPVYVAKDAFGMCKHDQSILIKGANWSDNDDNESMIYTCSSDLMPARLGTSKLKNRIKTISCLSISCDGRYMIVGEVGHKPRILVYSLAPDSNDFPVFAIQQHSYGVANLKFHPTDARIFMSLGLINDGFIHVWKLSSNGVTLIATNRNISSVKDVLWYNSKILTYGIRHLKDWKLENHVTSGCSSKSAAQRPRNTIKGKNVVLGEFLNTTFIDATEVDEHRTILLTDKNILVLYENGGISNAQNIEESGVTGQATGILADPENDTMWIISDGKLHYTTLEQFLTSQEKVRLNERIQQPSEFEKPTLTPLSNTLQIDSKGAYPSGVTGDSLNGLITLSKFDSAYLLYVTNDGCMGFYHVATKRCYPIVYPVLNNIAGYKRTSTSELLLWSKEGRFKKVDEETLQITDLAFPILPQIPVPEPLMNEVSAADVFVNRKGTRSLAAGTKAGDLYIFEFGDSIKKALDIRAHSSKVNDIVYLRLEKDETIDILVSISRDRTVQVFVQSAAGWELQETLADNKGNVIKLAIDGNILYIASADRSVTKYRFDYVDSELQIAKDKILSIKSAPINMHLFDDKLIISTNDKQLLVYDKALDKGRCIKLHTDNDEPITVDNLYLNTTNSKQEELLCSSSADKVLRCYNFATGKLMKQYFGHSEPILGLVTLNDERLLSVSSNGCIFLWTSQARDNGNDCATTQPTSTATCRHISEPLDERSVSRKIKKTEMARSPSVKLVGSSVSPIKLSPSSTVSSPGSPRLSKATTNQKSAVTPVKQFARSITYKCTDNSELSYNTLLTQLKRFRARIVSTPAEDNQNAEYQSIVQEIKIIFSIIEPQNKLLEKYSESLISLIEEKFQRL